MPLRTSPQVSNEELLEKIEALENLIIIGKWQTGKTFELSKPNKVELTSLIVVTLETPAKKGLNVELKVEGKNIEPLATPSFLESSGETNALIFIVPANESWELVLIAGEISKKEFSSLSIGGIGSKGEIGAEGPIGPKGEKGEIGEKGPKGETGTAGEITKTNLKKAIEELTGELNFNISPARFFGTLLLKSLFRVESGGIELLEGKIGVVNLEAPATLMEFNPVGATPSEISGIEIESLPPTGGTVLFIRNKSTTKNIVIENNVAGPGFKKIETNTGANFTLEPRKGILLIWSTLPKRWVQLF